MSGLKHTLSFSGSPLDLFESYHQFFRRKGFHIEEADAVALRLHAEKSTGLFSYLFGLGTLHVRVEWCDDGSTVRIRMSIRDMVLLEELKAIAARCVPVPQPVSLGQQPQIIVREIVKIPCKYCGSLIENTQTRCPFCGGE